MVFKFDNYDERKSVTLNVKRDKRLTRFKWIL